MKIIENFKVNKIDLDGNIMINDSAYKFDRIVNTCGPWAHELIEKSNIEGQFKLDLVEEVTFLLSRTRPCIFSKQEKTVASFVLPYNGNTLIGTTEVRQELNQPIEPSKDEINYYFPSIINTLLPKRMRMISLKNLQD